MAMGWRGSCSSRSSGSSRSSSKGSISRSSTGSSGGTSNGSSRSSSSISALAAQGEGKDTPRGSARHDCARLRDNRFVLTSAARG